MALIVEYHVIADQYPVTTTASGTKAGMCVALSGGYLIPAATNQTAGTVLGIAGDSYLASEGQTTAYSDSLYIGSNGSQTRYTANRVSDFYNETLASGKLTVYTGGGKFWISSDLFDSDGSGVAAGSLLTSSTTAAGEWKTGASAGAEYAIAVGASQAYASGVPGVDVASSMTLGNYVPVILRI